MKRSFLIVSPPPDRIAGRVQLTKGAARTDAPDYELGKLLERSK